MGSPQLRCERDTANRRRTEKHSDEELRRGKVDGEVGWDDKKGIRRWVTH